MNTIQCPIHKEENTLPACHFQSHSPYKRQHPLSHGHRHLLPVRNRLYERNPTEPRLPSQLHSLQSDQNPPHQIFLRIEPSTLRLHQNDHSLLLQHHLLRCHPRIYYHGQKLLHRSHLQGSLCFPHI